MFSSKKYFSRIPFMSVSSLFSESYNFDFEKYVWKSFSLQSPTFVNCCCYCQFYFCSICHTDFPHLKNSLLYFTSL